MNHEIKEEGNKITIRASVRARRFARDPVEVVSTKDILAILETKGYNLDKYKVVKQGSCSNYKPQSPISSEWILELKEEEREEKVVKDTNSNHQNRSRRSRRSQGKSTKKDQLLGNEDLGGVRSQAQTDLSGQD